MKKPTLVDEYMNETFDYGGELYTRAEIIRDMRRMGLDQPAIDMWFIGYEVGQGLARKRRARTRLAEANA